MKRIILGLALSVALFPALVVNAADSKIAYVDVKKAIENSDYHQQGTKSLKAWLVKKQEELGKYAKKIEALDKDIKSQGFALSADKKVQKNRQLKDLQKLFQRKLQDAQEDQAAKETELLKVGLSNFGKQIEIFGKKNGYDLIMPKRSILYANTVHDVTAEITKLLNKK